MKVLEKKFLIAKKVHNTKEAIKGKKNSHIVFISPAFFTKTHPEARPHSTSKFHTMSLLLNQKIVFALGGANKHNYKKFNKSSYGFGGISCFKEKK